MPVLSEPIIQTYNLLENLFDNYPANVRYFSVFFHRSSPSGIHYNSNLHDRIGTSFDDSLGELEGTFFDIDRNDPQSVADAIASIIYYMVKFNSLTIIKEGK